MPIRSANLSDVLSIAKVQVETWQNTYVGQVPQDILGNLSIEKRTQAWTDIINERKTSTFVVTAESEVVGFINIGPSSDKDKNPKETGEIYSIYLDKEQQGTGKGRELFNQALKYFREHGFKEFTLWVLESNSTTRGFYEAMGMQVDGAEKVENIGGQLLKELRYHGRL